MAVDVAAGKVDARASGACASSHDTCDQRSQKSHPIHGPAGPAASSSAPSSLRYTSSQCTQNQPRLKRIPHALHRLTGSVSFGRVHPFRHMGVSCRRR